MVHERVKNNFGKNLLSKKRKFSRKSFLNTLTVMLKGFLSYQSNKGGGSFGLLPITSLLQPRMSFKRYQSTSYDFLQLFWLCWFYYDVIRCDFQSYYKNQDFEFIKILFFYKTWCKITKKIVPVPFRRVSGALRAKKTKNIEILPKMFLK